MEIDLEAIKAKWLTRCGYCEAGLPQPCVCPEECTTLACRAVILDLVIEIERLRREIGGDSSS